MSIDQNNNKYAEAVKNHPIFQDNILKTDAEIKIMFENTYKFCKELIEGEVLNELECYEEDDEIYEDSNSTKESTNHTKENKKEHEANYEKNCHKKTNCNNQIDNDDIDNDDEIESDIDDDFDELKSQYALLLITMRLYKLFEHILLKKYVHELIIKKSNDNVYDFEKAIIFFKNKKIILNEEEEQSIYLLHHLSDSIENSFLYKNPLDIDYTILTDDEYMTNNIDPNFLFKTIEIAHTIVERIYST